MEYHIWPGSNLLSGILFIICQTTKQIIVILSRVPPPLACGHANHTEIARKTHMRMEKHTYEWGGGGHFCALFLISSCA